MNFKDKSAYLNGDLGGIIPGELSLSSQAIETTEGFKINRPLVYDIVYGLVTAYGGLTEDEINIDIPLKATMALRWAGE